MLNYPVEGCADRTELCCRERCQHDPDCFWVAVKELKLSFYNRETLFSYAYIYIPIIR